MQKLALCFLLTLYITPAISEDGFGEEALEQMALAFIEAKNARQQPDSDATDVENFLALLADDFVDEHIKFGVTVSNKDELRASMLQKLEDKVFFSRIEVDQVMIGRNVVFVKYTETAKVKPVHLDKVIEYSSTNIVSLEFDDQGLIKHIRRHHG
ncbi:MAG: nuclear transport factor 2 family protein [Woeseiaceae bacterium]|nr:nuclear transport factor 2 family protein [Woeseiaceae bacterium]